MNRYSSLLPTTIPPLKIREVRRGYVGLIISASLSKMLPMSSNTS
jgi:hypothetical protein